MEKVKTAVIGISGGLDSCLALRVAVRAMKQLGRPARDVLAVTRPGVACYASEDALLAAGGVQAAIVAVPHPLHSKIASLALAAGLHVLVEKPLDVRLSVAQALCAQAKASGKVFALMLNQRTNPLFAKARAIVQGGQLGQLKRSVWIITNWYRTQHYYDSGAWRATWAGEGGGVLLNQAPHNLDLWQWICGMPESVTGYCDVARYHHIEVEDDATIFAKYPNGATGVFITSTGEMPGTNRLEIAGTKGKLVLENGVLKWWRLKTPENAAGLRLSGTRSRRARIRAHRHFAELRGCDFARRTAAQPRRGRPKRAGHLQRGLSLPVERQRRHAAAAGYRAV